MKEDTQHNMTHHLDIFKCIHAGISRQNIAKANFQHWTFCECIFFFSLLYSIEKDQMRSCDSSAIENVYLKQSLCKPSLHYHLWRAVLCKVLHMSKLAKENHLKSKRKKNSLKYIYKHLKNQFFQMSNNIYFQVHQYIWNMTKN